MTFKTFSNAVRNRFADMSDHTLFQVNADRDTIWETYLSSFPPGTNPIFRKNTVHDCSCCRSFIRKVGNVVAIQNGTISTIWDLNGLPEPYQTVADTMAKYIRTLTITDVFLTKENYFGGYGDHELTDSGMLTFDHFYIRTPNNSIHHSPTEKRGEYRTTYDVLKRAIEDITPESVATVLDLIEAGSLYRGAEFKSSLLAFQRMFGNNPWEHIKSPAARLRNTAIGTLLEDLSLGMDLEKAVRSYESKVAPQNYKRPKALITQKMVDEAVKTLTDLGLEQHLHRRHARLSDVDVNNVLFVDRSVAKSMKNGSRIKDLLMTEVKAPKTDNAKTISIDHFVSKVLPKATSVNLKLENNLLSNFVSLTASDSNPEAPSGLFKWNNDLAWSYKGNVTDSIKERVKKAGGRVEDVKLRCSLAWDNTDDLDLHCHIPSPRQHIYYHNRCASLDVDANGGDGIRPDPVENMRWITTPPDGIYKFSVHNYNARSGKREGFEVEIEFDGKTTNLVYEKPISQNQIIEVGTITIKEGIMSLTISPHMKGGTRDTTEWGLTTNQMVPVNSIILSPNHWEDKTPGSKHWFFILKGARNPDPVRGFYNEFLNPSLDKHRKVFEVLGDKIKAPVVDEQMSGIGVTSARKEKVTVQVVGPELNDFYTIEF